MKDKYLEELCQGLNFQYALLDCSDEIYSYILLINESYNSHTWNETCVYDIKILNNKLGDIIEYK